MVRRDSENCHLSLSAVCDCHTRLLFYVSAVDSVKQKLSGKSVTKLLYELCHESVIMPCLFLTMLLG